MPEAAGRVPLVTAAALGATSGLRTTAAPAALALRGRWGRNGQIVAILAAAGEMAIDKHPDVPARSDLPLLAGRAASGAFAGHVLAGSRGAGAGAAGALATAYGSERLRAAIGERTGLVDIVLGAVEDALVVAAAAAATRAVSPALSAAQDQDGDAPSPRPAVDSPQTDPEPPDPEARPSLLGGAARGLLAAAVGTAAMTSAQMAYLKLTGGSPSSAPEKAGRRIIEGAFGQRVPRKRRPMLNQAMHLLYGTSWGLPYGLGIASLRRRPPASASGAALALTAWGVSLASLPALDLSPPPADQSPVALAGDLLLHLVYGGATAATYQALGG
ncbi:MAG: hypothetical protein WAK93_13045 [Solirubrobacteraceae bacterium]